MSEQLTTYTVKGKSSGIVWSFKYHLNGNLNEFKVLEGVPTQIQMEWLFIKGNFPYFEAQIISWTKKLKDNFEIIKGEPDISFDAVWDMYDFKVKRAEAEKNFKKLQRADVIKLILSIPGYKKFLQRKGTGQAYLSTFINQRYFEDDWSKAK